VYKIIAEVRTILEKVIDSTQHTGDFDYPLEPTEQPKGKQQVHTLSAASSPPPLLIEKIAKSVKSMDHEVLIKDMPMFILDLFTGVCGDRQCFNYADRAQVHMFKV